MYEKKDLVDALLIDNSIRRKRQKALDIQVIIGNPPYSIGQGSANDNNANMAYPSLDARIRDTYAAKSVQTSVKSLYDSYIRAIRWGSDRLGQAGVMAYVTNAGWIEGNAMDGLRRCLQQEFSSLYVFHLRGNARTSGEQRRKERGNVFGEGSRAPIAITLLVKNPQAAHHGCIYFHDIGDYLSREEKLSIIQGFHSIRRITAIDGWTTVIPNQYSDWLNQRDDRFNQFIVLGNKKSDSLKLFDNFSLGLGTNRDAWCYNSSSIIVTKNMRLMIATYNKDVERFATKPNSVSTTDFINTDPKSISWSSSLVSQLERRRYGEYREEALCISVYRPFQKAWLYYDGMFNHRVGQMPRIFPDATVDNLAIMVKGNWRSEGQFALMVDSIPCLQPDGGAQCFPLKLYEPATESKSESTDLFDSPVTASGYRVRDGITDAGLQHFQTAYPGETLTKEDLFYYVYGLLHSEDYRTQYADNLNKELPRIPCVDSAADFWAFSHAGRALGNLHVNYEAVEPYPVRYKQGDPSTWVIDHPETFYRVTKMKFGGKARDKDKTTVIYNANITMQDIPLDAYDYVVNGKPALEWVMERQVVKTDKASGIVNDANRYAVETVGDPAYPLKLFQQVIRVSLDTMAIVRALPKLEVKK